MRTDLFIEKMELKYCYNCSHYKKPVKGRYKKFEVVCQENMRLRNLVYHKTIRLNYIDRKAMTCGNFNQEFKPGK